MKTAKLLLELVADHLSSGDLFLYGSVYNHEAVISSSGDLIAFNLITDTTKIMINSSGDAEVFAARLLYVTINSSGSLYYKGHPKIYQTISSSGRIIDAN
jgi:hypothetical protein